MLKLITILIFLICSSCSSNSRSHVLTKEDKKFLIKTRSEKGTHIGGKAGYSLSRIKRINKINRAKAMKAIRTFCTHSEFSILIEDIKPYEKKYHHISNNINNKINIITFQCH